MNEMLQKVKVALRITTDAFDDEITSLIDSAHLDMGIAGVTITENELINRAVITYCKLHFGDLDTAEYDRLKASYDEQKAQMSMATGYRTE